MTILVNNRKGKCAPRAIGMLAYIKAPTTVPIGLASSK